MATGIFGVCAFATDKTSTQATDWVTSKLGTKLGDGDCVGLIKAYYTFLGETPVSCNAISYSYIALPDGWTRTQGGIPQNGDILIYNNGTAGHVAVYNSASDISYHQNWSGQKFVVTVNGYLWDNYYWGCIHPNFSDSTLTTDNDTAVNENVTEDSGEVLLTQTGLGDTDTSNSVFETIAACVNALKALIASFTMIYNLFSGIL